MAALRRAFPLALILAACNDGGPGTAVDLDLGSRHGAAPGIQPSSPSARALPLGALRPGQTRLVDLSPRYVFEYVGDETLRYVIDVSHPDVAAGLVRVEEETTGSVPMAAAGLTYRDAGGQVQTARWFATNVPTTVHAAAQGDTLTLTFEDDIDGGKTREVTIRLAGKALEVRLRDAREETAGASAFAGLTVGPMRSTPEPRDLRLPYMLATPVTRFTSPGGERVFASVQPDWTRSNGGRAIVAGYDDVTVTADGIDSGAEVRYPLNSAGVMNAPVDETVFVVVTRQLEDTFPETEAERSPYHDVLAGKTTALLSRNEVPWSAKAEHVEQLRSFGMDQLAIYDFYWWSESTQGTTPGGAQVQSHVWVPALDEPGCLAFSQRVREAGFLLGFYTLQGIQPSQPFHEPSDAVRSWQQVDLLRISPSRAFSHSLREDSEIKARYGSSFGFYDIWGHEHPTVVVDFDALNPDKAKTMGEAVAEKRRLFRQMQEIHEGPVLSEGGGAHNSFLGQSELLVAGFCDSVQSSFSTGAGADLQLLDPDDPFTPENWWVVPDYSLRVLKRLQVNHGMGFYDRFIHTAMTPLADSVLDRYRLYEITYGHSSFFQTTGPIDGTSPGQPNNRLWHADMVKEYYAMQGLQREYLTAAPLEIGYESGGQFVSASDLVKASDHPLGPLEDLRDPRIRVVYDNGLVVWLNHGPTPWPGVVVDDMVLTLPEDGYAAHNPASGLTAFSAIVTAPAALATPGRIDYAHTPGRHDMFDGRGALATFRGLEADPSARALAVRNHVRGLTLVEAPDRSIQVTQGPAPALVGLGVVGQTELAAGERARLRAIGVREGGVEEEVSHVLGRWGSDDPAVAVVNGAGVVTARAPGEARVTFRVDGGPSATHRVRVR